MLVVAALCAQTTTFLVKRLHPDLMPLPLCSLGPLLELLLEPVGERSFATQVVYFILWVTFGNVDYFLTFASVSDVRQNLGQPDGAISFSSHASFTGPFLVLESDSDPDD